MTAPAFRAAGSGPTSSATSTTIPKPTGTTAGDALYALVTNGGAAAAPTTVPDGWALTIGLAIGAGGWVGVYELVAGASEPTSYTWDGFVDSCAGSMVAISGADTTMPTHKVHATANLDSSSPSDSGVTTTVPDCLIIGGVGVGDNVGVSGWTATDPATLTERTEVLSTAGNDTTSSLASATGAQSAVGPTGALHVTLAGSRNSVVITLAVQPPQEGGGGSVDTALTATLPALNAAGAAAITDPAAAAPMLPAFTASATGGVANDATAAVTLPAVTAVTTAAMRNTATATAALPALDAATAAGLANAGQLAATLPAMDTAASIGERVDTTADAKLPPLAASLGTGTPPDTATLAATLPGMSASAVGSITDPASISAALPAFTASTAATLTVDGTADLTLPAMTGGLRASNPTATAALTASLPAMATTAAGQVSITGTTAAHLPAMRPTLGSSTLNAGTAAATLPALDAAASDAPLVVDELPDLAAAVTIAGRLDAAATMATLAATVTYTGRLDATVT